MFQLVRPASWETDFHPPRTNSFSNSPNRKPLISTLIFHPIVQSNGCRHKLTLTVIRNAWAKRSLGMTVQGKNHTGGEKPRWRPSCSIWGKVVAFMRPSDYPTTIFSNFDRFCGVDFGGFRCRCHTSVVWHLK